NKNILNTNLLSDCIWYVMENNKFIKDNNIKAFDCNLIQHKPCNNFDINIIFYSNNINNQYSGIYTYHNCYNGIPYYIKINEQHNNTLHAFYDWNNGYFIITFINPLDYNSMNLRNSNNYSICY